MESYPDPDPNLSANEEAPLINHGQNIPPGPSPKRRHRTRVLLLTIMFLTVVDWASYLGAAPQLDIFEGIICDKVYREANSTALRDINSDIGRDCTINSVQSELALITQILSASYEIPSIFLAIPYGALADRIGRRPVLFLSFIGLLTQDILIRCITWWPSIFPLWLVWLAPLTTLVGGGSAVASAMLCLAVTDVVEEHERATWFSRTAVAVIVGQIAAAPAASALMRWHGAWFPYLLSTVVFMSAIPLVVFFPETSQVITEHGPSSHHSPSGSIGQQLTLAIRRTFQSLRSVLNHRNIVLVLLSNFVAAIARNQNLDIQFMRQRFKWIFSSVSHLPGIQSRYSMLMFARPFCLSAFPDLSKSRCYSSSYLWLA
jgi:MFS family permease